MSKNKRKMEVRVELRKNAGEVLKPEKRKVDMFALVEVRTGLVLRWMANERLANREKERINNGGRV